MGEDSLLLHSWNAFNASNQLSSNFMSNTDPFNYSSVGKQSAHYLSSGYAYGKADMLKGIISRIALDASMVEFKHLKINEKDGNQKPIKSGIINCLTFEANIDQTGRAFIYDVVWSLLDEGVIAIVPVDTSHDPDDTSSYEVESIRVAKIVEWFPSHVKVRCYNEKTGLEQDIIMAKRDVAIIESPLYAVLQETNPTLALLQQKIALMQSKDKDLATGKINGFIQFPYQTKAESRKQQAQVRRRELEEEMTKSQYGLATLDHNEKFIPVGGGITNNLLEEVLKLKQDFYNQLGFSESIFNGTANQVEANQYYYRLIDPILTAITDAINRTFLTKTAHTQGHRIMFFRDPFRTIPVEMIASISDTFSRNAVFTPNEIRALVGKPPHPDVLADQLFNRNIADGNQNGGINTPGQMDAEMPQEEIIIYDDGNGGYVDEQGNPVDENGNPIE